MSRPDPPNPLDDCCLHFDRFLDRFKKRDPLAWEQAIRRYWPALLVGTRRRLAQEGVTSVDAEDVLQVVFDTAFHACDSLRADSTQMLGNWLAGIVRNVLRNELRLQWAQKRNKNRVENHDVSGLPTTMKSPSSLVARRDLADFAMDNLSTISRKIARWRMDGLSWKNIAEELETSPDCARMRLTRAREHLLNNPDFSQFRQPPKKGPKPTDDLESGRSG